METFSPNPPIMPPSSNPPMYGPIREKDSQPSSHVNRISLTSPVMLIFVVIVILTGGFFLFTSKKPVQPITTVPLSPTVTPLPTSTRSLSSFASQSAFLMTEQNIQQLPSAIQNAILDDATVNPPVLDLPLGFPNE
jgi:hypothetical protein